MALSLSTCKEVSYILTTYLQQETSLVPSGWWPSLGCHSFQFKLFCRRLERKTMVVCDVCQSRFPCAGVNIANLRQHLLSVDHKKAVREKSRCASITQFFPSTSVEPDVVAKLEPSMLCRGFHQPEVQVGKDIFDVTCLYGLVQDVPNRSWYGHPTVNVQFGTFLGLAFFDYDEETSLFTLLPGQHAKFQRMSSQIVDNIET